MIDLFNCVVVFPQSCNRISECYLNAFQASRC